MGGCGKAVLELGVAGGDRREFDRGGGPGLEVVGMHELPGLGLKDGGESEAMTGRLTLGECIASQSEVIRAIVSDYSPCVVCSPRTGILARFFLSLATSAVHFTTCRDFTSYFH